jgi:hypothetical protein
MSVDVLEELGRLGTLLVSAAGVTGAILVVVRGAVAQAVSHAATREIERLRGELNSQLEKERQAGARQLEEFKQQAAQAAARELEHLRAEGARDLETYRQAFAREADDAGRVRTLLKERLELQRDVYQQYFDLAHRWEMPPSVGIDSVRGRQDRDAEVHKESAAIYPRLAFAFDSRPFAEQAARALELLAAAHREVPRSLSLEERMKTWVGRILSEMQLCIAATGEALGLPVPRVPEAPIASADFSDATSRARFEELFRHTVGTNEEKSALRAQFEEALLVRRRNESGGKG